MNQKTYVDKTKELSGAETLDAAYAAIEQAFTTDANSEMPLFLAVQVDAATLRMNISTQGIMQGEPNEIRKRVILRQAIIQIANDMADRIQALEKNALREEIRRELENGNDTG